MASLRVGFRASLGPLKPKLGEKSHDGFYAAVWLGDVLGDIFQKYHDDSDDDLI